MSFSPVNAMVLSGATVTIGKWSAGEPLSTGVIIGSAFVAIALSGINEISPELAAGFGVLLLVMVLMKYGPAIFHKFGLINDDRYKEAMGL